MPKISELPAVAKATSEDLIPIVDDAGNITKKVRAADSVPLKGIGLGDINGGATAGVLTTDASGVVSSSQGIWWEEIGRTSTVITGTGGNNNMEITLSKPCKYVKIIASGKLAGASIYSWLRFNDVLSSTYDRSWMQTTISTGAVTGSSSQGTVATMGDADWDFYVEAEASAYRSGVVVYSGRMGSLRRTSNFGGYVSGGAATAMNKVRIGFDQTNVTQAELIILGHN